MIFELIWSNLVKNIWIASPMWKRFSQTAARFGRQVSVGSFRRGRRSTSGRSSLDPRGVGQPRCSNGFCVSFWKLRSSEDSNGKGVDWKDENFL